MTLYSRLALLCAVTALLCVVPPVSATELVTAPPTARERWQFVPAGPDSPCSVAVEEASSPNPFPTESLGLGITIVGGAAVSLFIFIWRRRVKPTYQREGEYRSEN
jgi:hypothetical protein